MTVTLAETAAPPLAALPFVFEDQASRPGQLIRLAILLPAALAVLVPIALIGRRFEDLAAIAGGDPVASVQLLAGLGIWIILFVMPVIRLIASFGWRRRVDIDAGHITVAHSSLFRRRTLRAPVHACHGIAHLVRTTNAGPRHELVLVHDQPHLCVPIHTADRIAPQTIARASALLGLAEIPARDVLRLRQGFAQPRPRPAP